MNGVTPLLRRGRVIELLEAQGIDEEITLKLMEQGVIKGAPLYKGGKNYYRWSQIEKDVLSESGNGKPDTGEMKNGARK